MKPFNKFALIPPAIGKEGICSHNPLLDEDLFYYRAAGFDIEHVGNITNLLFTDRVKASIFNYKTSYRYLDGFSPNLDKKLHVGHFMNLVYAKAFQCMNVANHTVAIYGDTGENVDYANENFKNFGYEPDLKFYASQIQMANGYSWLLTDGTGDYQDCKVFDEVKQVGIRSNGKTTYFYQDVALGTHLQSNVLYITGSEQSGHFEDLRKVLSSIGGVTHLPLGLIKLEGKKMSSRLGNTVMLDELLDILKESINEKFKEKNNESLSDSELEMLAYNAFAGRLLRSNPKSEKNIKLEDIIDLKQSDGLYLTYTLIRLKKLNIGVVSNSDDLRLAFSLYSSVTNLNPSLLSSELFRYCQQINKDYSMIKSVYNPILYAKYLYNLEKYMDKLGLFTEITRI